MIAKDVYDPLERYRAEFKDKFAFLAWDMFKALTATSGVDVAANRKLSQEIHDLERKADDLRNKSGQFGCLSGSGFLGLVVGIVIAVATADKCLMVLCVMGSVVGLLAGLYFAAQAALLTETLAKLEREISEKKAIAWEQMKPLNKLYTWDVPAKLINATVPKLEFDPYLSVERLSALCHDYNWQDCFSHDDTRSMLFVQTGVINGNSFAVVHYRQMEWETETYTGTKDIHYYVTETGVDGKRHRTRVTETLYASVTKPIPRYYERKLLIYGNEAAPNLSFSREPSGIDKQNACFFAGIKKHLMAHSIVCHARNMSEPFTMMQNEEFETMFHATDRDHEVEFRVLFTPVAMLQMLSLMKDGKVGYGDDFSFYKQNMINIICSKHLTESSIDTNPKVFKDWDYDQAARTFKRFNAQYFKMFYFSIAPVLAIPVYQQMRPHRDIWSNPQRRPASASWEHEAIANFHGQEYFEHPQCITENILKTNVVNNGVGETTIACTAYGYRGVQRSETERVCGGDGKFHPVRVEWTEYLPVHRTRKFHISEVSNPPPDFISKVKRAGGCACRRSIYSCLGPA